MNWTMILSRDVGIMIVLAVLIALYLGGGAMAPHAGLAFNSPISPLAPQFFVTPPWWDHTPTVTRAAPDGMPTWTPPDMWPTPAWYDDGTPPPPPAVTSAPGHQDAEMAPTPVPFVPVSPIMFHSPVATPRTICVAPGMSSGHVLCYGD